ncbi:nucleoplasmin-like protein [Chironomus tepperi]|uniref:nucleoplasmin-like protein n=1 Tax=Chironomus tepperi TaxID=113505 RepID=UPI00391F36F2
MADEFFYGVTLKGANAHVLWNPESTSGAEELEYPRANKLIVKQILLGVEAKQDEYNVVEVETKSEDSIVKIPIAVLKVGENRCSQSFLEFPDNPVKFTLIQGEGPVHIHGHHLIGEIDTDEIEEEIDEEEFDDEEDQEEPKNKKAKIASQNSKGAKNDKNSKKK